MSISEAKWPQELPNAGTLNANRHNHRRLAWRSFVLSGRGEARSRCRRACYRIMSTPILTAEFSPGCRNTSMSMISIEAGRGLPTVHRCRGRSILKTRIQKTTRATSDRCHGTVMDILPTGGAGFADIEIILGKF